LGDEFASKEIFKYIYPFVLALSKIFGTLLKLLGNFLVQWFYLFI